jgi:hypothetical protein
MRTKKTKYPGVYRVVYPASGIDGYLAKVIRSTGKLQKVFQLSAFAGNHGKCLKAAARAAAMFSKAHPRLSRREIAALRRPKKDGDLPVGVRRVRNQVKGKFYDYYEAAWSPKPNQQAKQRFSVNLYGKARARKLAVKARERGLEEMKG